MADLNHVVLIGRLTRDAELKYTASGQAVCKFSIAVNRRKKNGDQWEDEANFFDIVLWGRQGESLQQYLVKGKMVGIDGELRQDRWQQDGQNRSKVEVVASYLQLLGGGGAGSGANSGGSAGGGANNGGNYGSSYNSVNNNYAPPQFNDNNQSRDPAAAASPSRDDFTDDIPF